jgi:hypothetical protein
MKKLLLPIIAVCCLSPVAVLASQQHPLITDMAETVAPKSFEAETAVEFYVDKTSGYDSNQFIIQETVTGGIIPKLDAFVTIPFETHKVDAPGLSRESGLNDITIGAKYNFMNVKNIAFAVKPALLLPVGDDKKGLGYGKVGFGATAIASIELDKRISIDANVAFKYQGVKNGDSFNEFGGAVAGKYVVIEKLKAVAEFVVSKSDVSGSKAQAVFGAGAIYAIMKNLDVDAGLRVGLTSDSPDFGFLVGATYKF